MHAGVTIAALCLAAAGVLFLFAPQEVGAALSKSASNGTVTSAFLVLTGLYVLGAALFVYLTFFSSGLRAKPASTSRAGA